MAASWDLPLPLVIICLGLTRSIYALPMTPKAPDIDPLETRWSLVAEDYNDFDTSTVNPPKEIRPYSNGSKCDYNPCLENQRPCSELKASGCLCPGFTVKNEAPSAPDKISVSWNGSDVIVKWCETSFVTKYVVRVGQDIYTFGANKRSGSIKEVEHITQVCVSAVNNVGESSASCLMYQPRGTSRALKAGLIGGAVGLMALLLLVILLWRHRRQRKQEANISLGDTANAQ